MPTRDEAKEAVKTLLGYLEKDVEREGLLDTPDRVVDMKFSVAIIWMPKKF